MELCDDMVSMGVYGFCCTLEKGHTGKHKWLPGQNEYNLRHMEVVWDNLCQSQFGVYQCQLKSDHNGKHRHEDSLWVAEWSYKNATS